MKKQMNFLSENGITLSALIITIVVMLILADITISVSYKQSNIINTANDAMQDFNERAGETTDELNDLVDHIDSDRRGVTSSDEVGFSQVD